MTRIGIVSLALVAALAGCSERESFSVGSDCSLNSDCDSSLVCRLGRCRVDCLESRDCAAGLICLKDPALERGGCQIDDEGVCLLNSDCLSPLVCRFGTCTTECATSADCLDGASCAPEDGVDVCLDESRELCVYNSDCGAGLVCLPSQVCHFECLNDRDCPAPRSCDLPSRLCVLPADAGTP